MFWWDGSPAERYWMEITERFDVGSDLKCPQLHEGGKEQHSYSLIRAIAPGDIVFHYSTRERAFVGASVAGAPIEQRPIVWSPHGTARKSQKKDRQPRPGWWLPVYGFRRSDQPLTLKQLHTTTEDEWVRSWITQKHSQVDGPVFAPFQRYKGRLRAAQGYLAKMPADFVARWQPLKSLVAVLEPTSEKLVQLGDVHPCFGNFSGAALKFKSEDDYIAVVAKAIQKRSRRHERIVRLTAEFLSQRGADPFTRHPIDLEISTPTKMIFEAKVVLNDGAIFAIRHAIGQLLEYRYFLGPRDAQLCIVLDKEPTRILIDYVEDVLGVGICWVEDKDVFAGAKTAVLLQHAVSSLNAAAGTIG